VSKPGLEVPTAPEPAERIPEASVQGEAPANAAAEKRAFAAPPTIQTMAVPMDQVMDRESSIFCERQDSYRRYDTTLRLVPKGSPEACQLAGRLSQHKCTLTLSNGLAIGPKWDRPRNAWGQWDYIDLGVGEGASNSMEVHLNEEGFIVWNGAYGEMVLDVNMWRMEAGNHLVLVKGVGEKSNNTMREGDNKGRLFVQNSDGTISPKHAQHLVLGVVSAPPPVAVRIIRQLAHPWVRLLLGLVVFAAWVNWIFWPVYWMEKGRFHVRDTYIQSNCTILEQSCYQSCSGCGCSDSCCVSAEDCIRNYYFMSQTCVRLHQSQYKQLDGYGAKKERNDNLDDVAPGV
jgi:hypothetical protein